MNQDIKDYMSFLGKRSLVTMTPEQRSERARKAGKAKGKKHATQTTTREPDNTTK